MDRSDLDPHTAADRDFHDATAHLYDDTLLPIFGVYEDLVIHRLLDELRREAPGENALDVGCGTGIVAVELARRGFRVQGIDHSPAMLAIARAKLDSHVPAAQVSLHLGDIRTLPFADCEFEVLTCQGVLHHLRDLPSVITELARVLAPEGVFYLAEPCQGSNRALRLWERARRLTARVGSGQRIAGRGEPLDIPDHDEAPVDQALMLGAIHAAGLAPRVEYWSRFAGLDRLPAPMQRFVLRGLTRPWRHRSGNMLFVTGRKPI